MKIEIAVHRVGIVYSREELVATVTRYPRVLNLTPER